MKLSVVNFFCVLFLVQFAAHGMYHISIEAKKINNTDGTEYSVSADLVDESQAEVYKKGSDYSIKVYSKGKTIGLRQFNFMPKLLLIGSSGTVTESNLPPVYSAEFSIDTKSKPDKVKLFKGNVLLKESEI